MKGLIRGLAVTLRHLLRRSTTRQYPEVQPELPPRSRGVIALHAEHCTSCMLCARECPDWCIYIESHKEPDADGKNHNELDRFAIDFSLCMYCGICIEVCPFDALFWAPNFDYAAYDVVELTHDRDVLGGWLDDVPMAAAQERGQVPAGQQWPGPAPARPVDAPPAEPVRLAAVPPGAARRAAS